MKYKINDLVRSVGGNFTKGIVLEVNNFSDTEQYLKIRWIESDKGSIDFIQTRSSDIVKRY